VPSAASTWPTSREDTSRPLRGGTGQLESGKGHAGPAFLRLPGMRAHCGRIRSGQVPVCGALGKMFKRSSSAGRSERAVLRILGIMGSPRLGGNTDLLLDAALNGARSAGAEVEKIVVDKLNISPCREHYGCLEDGNCIIRTTWTPSTQAPGRRRHRGRFAHVLLRNHRSTEGAHRPRPGLVGQEACAEADLAGRGRKERSLRWEPPGARRSSMVR